MCIAFAMNDAVFYLSKNTSSPTSHDVFIKACYARLLKPFQIEGIRFLYRQYLKGCGAVLNDDNGLGKTVQTSLFLSSIPSTPAKPSLVLCSEKNLNHWLYHFHNWSSDNSVLCYEDTSTANIVIATLNDLHLVDTLKWGIIVIDDLDPLQIIKQVDSLNCIFKIWLCKDDLLLDLKKLYLVLNCVSSNKIGTKKDFERLFSEKDDKISSLWKQRQYLNKFCNRWLLRRTKNSVEDQLPLTDIKEHQENFESWLKGINKDRTKDGESFKANSNNQPTIEENTHVSVVSVNEMAADLNRFSPSMLDFTTSSFLDSNGDKNNNKRRKGKDDTGLKIKRSKPKPILESTIMPVPVIENTMVISRSESNSEKSPMITPEIKRIKLEKQNSIENEAAVQKGIFNIINNNCNEHNQSQSTQSFQLLDSFLCKRVQTKSKGESGVKKLGNNHNGIPIKDEINSESIPQDHSMNTVEKMQFSLLDSLF